MIKELFFWEKLDRGLKIKLSDFRGTLGQGGNDTDCRNYGCNDGLINDWSVLCSPKNWGEKHINPQGLPDGDTGESRYCFRTFEDSVWCDYRGQPYFDSDNSMQISGRGEFD
jgi:hypothetical protein